MITWIIAMKMKLSARAQARILLEAFNHYQPLSPEEAAKVRLSLENSGVPDASTRLNATWSKIILQRVAQ